MTDKKDLIEFTGSQRNIIRYCVEYELKRKMEDEYDDISPGILMPILDKLRKLHEREVYEGTAEKSIFI